MSDELTPTMTSGLLKMAKRLHRSSACMAEPNDNTGRALLRRGLVEVASPPDHGWTTYRLTDAGKKRVAEIEARK